MDPGFQIAHGQARAYDATTRRFMDGAARLLVERCAARPGDAVLDLASGTGLVATHALELVGAHGRVVGADINPGMLAFAREHADPAIEWVQAPADQLPFEDASFARVVCQQGLQFFPDPVGAVREVRRVLVAGGVFAASVWATPGHNPYIETQLELLAEIDPGVAGSVARATPPDADAWLAATARAGGFGHAEVTLLEHTVELPELGIYFLDQTASTPWAPVLAALTDAQKRELAERFTTRLAGFQRGDGTAAVPFGSHCLLAR